MELAERIQQLYAQAADADRNEARGAFAELRRELAAGRVRAAEPDPSSPTGWRVNAWVKQGILVGFRCGDVVAFDSLSADSPYLDKDTLPLRPLSIGLQRTAGPRRIVGARRRTISAAGSSACRRCTSTSARTSGTAA